MFFRTFAEMSNRLQEKWKVNSLQFVLIIATFAIGGSLTGYLARKLMPVFEIGPTPLWIVVYILVVTLLWPLFVLLISIPFGQYRFFIKYIRKIGARIGIIHQSPPLTTHDLPLTNIAIFASGTGTNAEKIIEYFRRHPSIKISLIVCNRPQAGVLKIADQNNIPVLMIERERFSNGDAYLDELKSIDFIVLAGFLWKLPVSLIKAFRNRIINIHPALLPKHGGKGMYGRFVHEAVIRNREEESGISIHYVDEIYDHGKVIFQAKCPVLANDTADSLAKRIHLLEHEHYPIVIERVITQNKL